MQIHHSITLGLAPKGMRRRVTKRIRFSLDDPPAQASAWMVMHYDLAKQVARQLNGIER